MGDCSPDGTLADRMLLGHNRVMVPGAQATVTCGKTYAFSDWVALGVDPGTTISEQPSTQEIIEMARAVLGMPSAP